MDYEKNSQVSSHKRAKKRLNFIEAENKVILNICEIDLQLNTETNIHLFV